MDGGGSWNHDAVSSSLRDEHGVDRVDRFLQNVAPHARVLWPEYEALQQYTHLAFGDDTSPAAAAAHRPYMSNFNDTGSCGLRAAMCCFVDKKKKKNGSALAAANQHKNKTRVCHHDLYASRRSTHVGQGYGVYTDDGTTMAAAHCVGMAWDANEGSDSYQYRGNVLADISFGTFQREGYSKNIPGSPMCACVEQMPVVTRDAVACRKATVTNERYTLTNVRGHLVVVQDHVNVSYTDCGVDFKSYYLSSPTTTRAAAKKMNERIVESCNDANSDFLNGRFLVKDTTRQFERPSPDRWIQVAGMGLSYHPVKTRDLARRDAEFRSLLSRSPHGIVLRHCENCLPSHQYIYYKRLTPNLLPPTSINYLDVFLNNWRDYPGFHRKGVHYQLYSTYDDTIRGVNPWTYCNYNKTNIGFPRECGPHGLVPCQWNSYKRNLCHNREYAPISHGFYVEKAPN